MATAYSYLRFSSPEQGKGDSIRRQLEASQRYCEQHGLTLDSTLQDHGISAFKGANRVSGNLGAFIQAIDQGQVQPGSYLLVESIDRLSRDQIMESLNLFTSILSKGITIVTLSDNKIYTRDSINNLPDLMYSLLIMSRAHEESAIKSQRVAAAWANKRDNARRGVKYTKKCPAWIRLVDDHFQIITDRANIIKRIFDLCISGHGSRSIARTFNLEGIDTWGDGIQQSRQADGWHHSYIKKILQSPSTYGTLIPGKMNGDTRELLEPIADYYPAIISHQTFLEAQHAVASRTGKGGKPGNHINVLQGLIICSVCKGSIVRLNKGQAVYACDKGRRGVSDCTYKPWAVEGVEQAVLFHLTELDLDSILSRVDTKLKVIRGSISALTVQLNDTQVKADRLVDLLANGAANSPTLLSRLQSFESDIVELNNRLESLRGSEQEEVDSISSAQLAQQDVSNLMVTDNRDMRIRLQSSIRNLISSIKLNLWKKKITIYYRTKEPNGAYQSKVIMQSGKSVVFNHDIDAVVEL